MKLPKSFTIVTTLSKLLALLLFILFPLVGFKLGMSYQKATQFNQKVTNNQTSQITPISGDIVEFEGTLVDFVDTCVVDGACKAIVDNYAITIHPGEVYPFPALGKSDIWTDDIGSKVKVRAKVIGNNKLTIIGSENLYVLKISTPIDKTASWKTYRNEEYGFEFRYPDDLLTLEEKDLTVVLTHSVPYTHMSPCSFVGNESPLQEVADFKISLTFKNSSIFSAIKNDKIIGEVDYVILQEPGHIDWVTIGDLDGYKITTGTECGLYTYYLGVSNNKTLVVTKPWELSTEYNGMPEIFKLPNIISDDYNNSLFNQILSTFRFLDEDTQGL